MNAVRTALVFLLSLASTLVFSQKQPGDDCTREDSFPTSCSPFHAKHHQAIDDVCGPAGDAQDAGDAAQDKAKNNLCSTGDSTEITIDDLKDLQDSVDGSGLVYGNRHVNSSIPPPPVNRETFFGAAATHGLGEGAVVSFVGYIAETRAGSAESVNCHCNGVIYNDIHVALAPHALHLQKAAKDSSASEKKLITTQNNEALCTDSFTAEITPHLRPSAFTRSALNHLIDAKVVKITGQLFFDAAHHPCDGTVPGSQDPARFTSWEIHPVYLVQVCRKSSLDQCPADDPSVWKEM
jgi:hypothetical protein